MEGLGYSEVQTYIQSGNIVFKTEAQDKKVLAQQIRECLFDHYQFDVKVMVLSNDYLTKAIAANPFLKREEVDISKVHFTFLDNMPTAESLLKLDTIDYAPDEYRLVDTVIYVYCPNGYGNTKLSNNYIESKLKIAATSRNARTTNILCEMSSE